MAKVQFHRFSPYFMEARKYGLDLQPSDFYPLTYPFTRETLAKMAYHFVDSNFKADYIHTMIKWIVKIGEPLSTWQSQWKRPSHERPKLFVKAHGKERVVHDTRYGELVEHPLSETRQVMLEQMSKPKRISQLANELPEADAAALSTEMQWFKERGLVFQEGDRFLSLPLPREPSNFSFNLDQDMQDIQQLVHQV
jgi:hypothetical protein